MSRPKDKIIAQRGKDGHRGLRELMKQKRVSKSALSAGLNCSGIYVEKLCRTPLILNGYQMLTIAGILSVSPEFLYNVIRFNKHTDPNPPEVNEELTEFQVKFPINTI